MRKTDEPTDNVFDALSNSSRRKLLASLIADSPPDDVAQRVSNDDIRLYHTHLSKLDDYGVVDWDEDAGEVTKGPNFARACPSSNSSPNTTTANARPKTTLSN